MLNDDLEKRLTISKNNFISYLEKYKTKESHEFDRLKEMSVIDLIQEYGYKKHLIQNNQTMSILMLCNELGIDINNDSDTNIFITLRNYMNFFIEVANILGC